ncbi:unnamed protein product [Brassicogethes aeneus]|uniref:Intraflagellar transport protein 56 n=1 Tax=Brassicogethes aeneus TaxID=1431903 RepID=A0A9P0BH61_BRAAE|nr:unnamed protein product [Brassicogethes aeneus]
MILSRSKPALGSNSDSAKGKRGGNLPNKNTSQFEEYLSKRDYAGAITLLEFKEAPDQNGLFYLWMAYCAFHKGDYKKSLSIYQNLYKNNPDLANLAVNIACCYFYLDSPTSGLKVRLNFHLSHKLRDESALMESHQQLQDVAEDQLSLAAIHYLRAHYQEAIDIYKRLLLQNRDNLALNVYVALCYYKLDYYDVSQEVLGLYLSQYSDSVIATNLKVIYRVLVTILSVLFQACNSFRLYNGPTAENEIRSIVDQCANEGFGYDLIKHNLVVFRDGEGAMQVFPGLVDVVPEARLNLVIHYLRNNDTKEAYDLLKDLQPSVPQEYILKGVVNAALGQDINSHVHIKTAEECFNLVGSSSSECDTIHGRQSMAATFFLSGQFEEVLVYLTSIKSYLHADDTFNFNFAQAKTACHQYKEAEEIFLLIKNHKMKQDYVYISNLARCYVMNRKAQLAWELYIKMESSPDSFNLLLLIANDCYKIGEFWYAAKAFDMLDRLEPNPEFWEGKRGAVVGVFQMVIANKFSVEGLGDILQLLRGSSTAQAENIARVIRSESCEFSRMVVI